MARGADWRRQLGRELSRRSRMSVAEILAAPPPAVWSARRIGVTGPPGAGKSSLIGALAAGWLGRGREVGVLAVDPTSPVSRGSLLGDRIRMDEMAEDARLFVRSVPSGACHDGLCQNAFGLLGAFEAAGFDDIVLETVGVGQVSYEARKLVDVLVLVLLPESGDTVQAMKAGILELADIYVVNKADLPAASRLAAELEAVLRRRPRADGQVPPVILASARERRGIAALDAALAAPAQAAPAPAASRRHQLEFLLRHRLAELGTAMPTDTGDLRAEFNALLSAMSLPP